MNDTRTHTLLGASLGLAALGMMTFILTPFVSTNPGEPLLPPLLLVFGLLGLATCAPEAPERSAGDKKFLWMPTILGFLAATVVATTVIQGDIRSWLLVALVVLASVLLVSQTDRSVIR